MTTMCDNSKVAAYINNQGGTVSRSLCLLASQLLRWGESLDVHLDVRYLPGQSNVLADLCCRDQVIGTEWSVTLGWRETCFVVEARRRSTCLRRVTTRSSSCTVPLSWIPRRSSRMCFVILGATWTCMRFHPSQRDPQSIRDLVAPLWLEKDWLADLLLLTQPPVALPWWDQLLRHPHFNRFHNGAHALNLHAW